MHVHKRKKSHGMSNETIINSIYVCRYLMLIRKPIETNETKYFNLILRFDFLGYIVFPYCNNYNICIYTVETIAV